MDILLLLVMCLMWPKYGNMSMMYAHDKMSDIIAQQCLNEMFSNSKYLIIQESDEPCIIFCVLKKFGIMSSNGAINLDIYRKRLLAGRPFESEHQINSKDYGGPCVETAEATQHKQDVCKKAKVFNDCTHLFKILVK